MGVPDADRQKDKQTDKQTNKRILEPTPMELANRKTNKQMEWILDPTPMELANYK